MDGERKISKTIKTIREIRKQTGSDTNSERSGAANKRGRGNGSRRNRRTNNDNGQNGVELSHGNRATSRQKGRKGNLNQGIGRGVGLSRGVGVGPHLGRLKEMRNGETGMVQRIDYDTAMPMLEPTVSHYGKTGEGMMVRGSEFMTDITCNTTEDAIPSLQGFVLYSIPLNPMFWVGTRIKKFYEMYRKYLIRDLVFELIPSVPSTTSGALLGFCSHDPDANPSLIEDLDARMRAMMAVKGARIWNVYSSGRVSFSDDGTFGWYFTGDGQDDKLSTQGTLYIAISSAVTTASGTDVTTLGQLVLHYDIAFEDRVLDEEESGAITATLDMQGAANTVFFGAAADSEVFIKESAFTAIGLPVGTNVIYIIICETTTLVAGSVVLCNTEERTDVTLFIRGSVWYAWANQSGDILMCTNLADAVGRHEGVWFKNSLNLASTISGQIKISSYTTDYNE